MGDNLYGSYIHNIIDVPQFNYDGFHTVGLEFNEDMLIDIVKNWHEEENYEFNNKFHNEEGDLKGRVTESRIP